MENRRNVKHLIPLLAGLFLIFSGTAMAYGPETHAYLTDEAINFFNQKTTSARISPDLRAFVIDGSRREDDIPRFMNHFYDPVYNRGISTDYSITPLLPIGSWESAKDWADDSANQNNPLYKTTATIGSILNAIEQKKISAISSETDFTWSKAIDLYAAGKNEEAMFALGHVLHLMEDMSVPDHTRNDAHAHDSPYELYADNFLLGQPDQTLPAKLVGKPLLPLDNLDDLFDGLATYSNNNFYSKDTIGIQSGYNLPQPDYFTQTGEYYLAIKSDSVDGNHKLFLKKSVHILDTVASNTNNIFLFADGVNGDQVMKDYWSHLSPKSTQYAASVINLFFKEAEAARKEYNANPPVIEEEKSFFGQIMDGIGSWLLGLTEAGREAWLRVFGDQFETIGEFPLNPQNPIEEEGEEIVEQYREKPLISVSKLRIAKGETNQIQGSRFASGAKILVSIERPDKIRIEVSVVSDNSGRIVYQYKSTAYDPIGVYYVSAKDSVSGLATDRIKFELAEAIEKTEEETTEESEDEEVEDDLRFCDFGTSSYGSGQAIFNEIAWMGSSASANHEWMEIKNLSTGTIDISGWQILDKDKAVKIRFPAGAKIPAGGFYLLERTSDASVPGVSADLIYTGTLANSGEDLKLFNSSCGLVDAVLSTDGWPAGDAASRKTMEKDLLGSGWHTSSFADGTPKQENSSGSYSPPLPPPATPSNPVPATVSFCDQFDLDPPTREVLINEIAWAGSIVSSSDEWIELKNTGSADIPISDWQLLDKAGDIKIVFPGSAAIPADGFYLLERTDDETVPGIAADLIYTGGINNSEETLRLFDGECGLVDEVAGVGENWENIAGTGAPDYRTAERTNANSWHTYRGEGTVGIKGTPKSENSIPEEGEEESGVLSADDWQISYDFDQSSVDFSLPINDDVSYRILDMESGEFTDVVLNAGGIFSKRIDEVGRSYEYRIRVKSEDGTDLGYSDIKTIDIPSYIRDASFYRASHYTLRGEEVEEPLFEFSYDGYPFMPRDVNLAYGEPPGPNYKIMVFYLNQDAPKDLFLNVDQPLAEHAADILKTKYSTCGGMTDSERSSVVFVDAAEGCNIFIGGVPNSALTFDTYFSEGDNRLLLPIMRSSGETVFSSEDFITVAFYGLYRFYPQAHEETDIFRLLAVDKQKYYFGEAPEHLAPTIPGEIAVSFDSLKSELAWNISPASDPDSLDPLLRYEISYDEGANWEDGALENKKTVSPGENYNLWIRAIDDFGLRSEPVQLEYAVPASPAPFGLSNISWRNEAGSKKILSFDYPQYPFIPGENGFKAMVFYLNRLPPENYNGGYTGGDYPRIQTKHFYCASFDPEKETNDLKDLPILILADSAGLVRDSFGGSVTDPNKCFTWTHLPCSEALVPVPDSGPGRISLEISGLLDSDRSLDSLASSDFFTTGFYEFDSWGNGILVANDGNRYYFSP